MGQLRLGREGQSRGRRKVAKVERCEYATGRGIEFIVERRERRDGERKKRRETDRVLLWSTNVW